MGISLKDIMKDDKNSLVEDKQKKTIKTLVIIGAIILFLIVVVIMMIITNMANNARQERVRLIAKDVVNISNVVKKIGEQYISNTYDGTLVGTSLDNTPNGITINVNGKNVQYRYGYYYLTAQQVAELITSLNVPNEEYLVNYINGDVVNLAGVKTKDGRKYYSKEDITAIDQGENVKNIIYIHTAQDMELMHTYPSGNFCLSEDIDMTNYGSSEGWKPVESFSGTFDGRNYTITGLTLARPTSTYCGLFGQVSSNSYIKDVKFKDVSIRGGQYTGVVAGFCSGNISNITITGGSVNSQAESVGGLVGSYDKGNITDCFVKDVSVNANGSLGGLIGTLYSGTIQRSSADVRLIGINSVGGLIGEIRANSTTSIREAYANASITGKNEVGGLIGDVQIISPSLFKLSDCYSEGAITGGIDNVGGSIGNIYATNSAEIDIQSVYTATDTNEDAKVRGGFIGKTNITTGVSTQVIKCCFEKDPLLDLNVQDVGDKTDGSPVTIDSKTPAEMKNRVSYADWDFDLWVLEEGVNRPRLRWEYENYEPQEIIEEK